MNTGMAKQRRRARLLVWRLESLVDLSAELLAASLSCEALPWDASVPHWLERAVVEFRKLRQDARVAACRAFMAATFEDECMPRGTMGTGRGRVKS